MNTSEKAEAALEEALHRQDFRPLHTLIGVLIRHLGTPNAQELSIIRDDVYLGLTKLRNKGQTLKQMGQQLYRVVERCRASYYRRTLNKPELMQLEAVDSGVLEDALQVGRTSGEPTLNADQEEKCEAVAQILLQLATSGKESDRKRYLAVTAEIMGEDPMQALRREFPDVTPNNASQLKHRGLELVRAEYEASRGKKAS
jgi:hypothetical protein